MMTTRPLRIDEIGAARASKTINTLGRTLRKGDEIPLDELRTWRNRNVMIEKGYIEVWPKSVSFIRAAAGLPAQPEPEDDDDAKQRIVMPRGFGKYCVIEGRIVADGITKDEADQIAGTPQTASRSDKPVFRKHDPRSRSPSTSPEPKMPMGIKPADEPNGPVEG